MVFIDRKKAATTGSLLASYYLHIHDRDRSKIRIAVNDQAMRAASLHVSSLIDTTEALLNILFHDPCPRHIQPYLAEIIVDIHIRAFILDDGVIEIDLHGAEIIFNVYIAQIIGVDIFDRLPEVVLKP